MTELSSNLHKIPTQYTRYQKQTQLPSTANLHHVSTFSQSLSQNKWKKTTILTEKILLTEFIRWVMLTPNRFAMNTQISIFTIIKWFVGGVCACVCVACVYVCVTLSHFRCEIIISYNISV